MPDDKQLLLGKWTVWVKDWAWEYEFSADGTVVWRDTRSLERGIGRWTMSPSLVNLQWRNSTTKESWRRPLKAARNSNTFYSSSYFSGPYNIEKRKEIDLPKTVQPDPVIDIELWDPQDLPNYIDRLCTHVAYGIYNGGFWVYVPPAVSPLPIEIPEKIVWFGNSGRPVSCDVFDNQAEALQRVGVPNPDRIGYYHGVGGKVVCPTAFTLRTAPTIVNTASLVVDELIEEVTCH